MIIIAVMAGISGQVIKSANFIIVSRNFHNIFGRLLINNAAHKRKFSNASVETEAEADPAPYFFNEEIQKMLKQLTRPDMDKVYRVRKDGSKIRPPKYKFLTDAQLKEEIEIARAKVEEKLQMPPVLKERKPINKILSKDPAFQGFDTCKWVITDITYNVKNAERLIVTREPDGILRYADWEERYRMNQIYFPIKGREIIVPMMFSGEYLEDLLKREEFEFILDRACVQYDPDDPEYFRVTKTVYEAVHEADKFEVLRSTRHFGPMTFYFVWTRNIDKLLLDMIKRSYIDDAALLIRLYAKINQDDKAAELKYSGDDVEFVEAYINLDAENRGKLIAAINSYKEIQQSLKDYKKGVETAHGLK